MNKQIVSSLLLFLFFVTACAPPETLPKEDQLATIVASTLTAHPSLTPLPASTATPLLRTLPPTITAMGVPPDADPPTTNASATIYVRTIVQNVNLRTQPGTLFPVSRVMPQGTRLQALGLSPGGEWVYVLNDEGINGWVSIQVVDEFPAVQFPIVDPVDVQRITGRVLDANGLPVSGIGYALEQQSGSKTLRTDALTDAAGTFYAFLPKSASGGWTVSYVSIACTSNMMDANCNCLNGICGTSYPVSASVSLPVNEPLIFTWK